MPKRPSGALVRTGTALFAAIVGAVVATFGDIHDKEHRLGVILPTYIGAAVVLIAGFVAVKASSRGVRESASDRMGDIRGAALSKFVGFFGATIVLLWTLSTLGVGIQALLLGGALTGVVVGIAAQQSLGNVIAGIILMVVKPFTIGEETVIKSTLGEYEGRIDNIGFMYVSMATKNGPVDIPNGVALASAVGPGARTTPKVEPQEEEPVSES